MSQSIIETITFSLVPGTDPAHFAQAARDMNDWVGAQPGFVRRRLSHAEDGTWIDHIEWKSMAAAQAAAAGVGAAPGNAPFLSAIDGPSVTMRHSVLDVALG